MTDREPKPSKINNDLIIYRLDEIKEKLSRFETTYVTKEESAALKHEIVELRNEIAEIKRSRNLIGWLYPTASAAFSAVFTYLLIKYIDRS
jgi:hypothetical protein